MKQSTGESVTSGDKEIQELLRLAPVAIRKAEGLKLELPSDPELKAKGRPDTDDWWWV